MHPTPGACCHQHSLPCPAPDTASQEVCASTLGTLVPWTRLLDPKAASVFPKTLLAPPRGRPSFPS